jgi:hypothetical protein
MHSINIQQGQLGGGDRNTGQQGIGAIQMWLQGQTGCHVNTLHEIQLLCIAEFCAQSRVA